MDKPVEWMLPIQDASKKVKELEELYQSLRKLDDRQFAYISGAVFALAAVPNPFPNIHTIQT